MQNYRRENGVSSHGLKTGGFPRHEFYESETRHELNMLKKAIRSNPNVILQENPVTEMFEIAEEK